MINYNFLSYKLFAALLLSCFFYGCENSMKEVAALGKKKVQVDEGINISSYLSQKGIMKGHLTAPLMFNYHDSAITEFPKGIYVEFYKNDAPILKDSLMVETILTAKYSKYLQREQKIFLKDSIIVFNKLTGDTLHTQELWWDQLKGIIYTDKPVDVYIKANEQSLHGQNGLTALQDFTKWTLHGTTGSMQVPEGIQ